jgi:hypothetical protein
LLACASRGGEGAPLEAPVGQTHEATAVTTPDSAWESYASTDPGALADFDDVLAPYGRFDDDPRFGTVWRPRAPADFVPYATHGRWTWGMRPGDPSALREYVWVSELPWGWVTFHFGRWVHTGEDGWAWVPGRRYAGAWVVWRTSGEHVGWGPAPAEWLWRDGRPLATHAQTHTAFVYCRKDRLFAPNLAGELARGDALFSLADRSVAYARPADYARPTLTPDAPSPEELGVAYAPPPPMDPGLQRAWLLARPSTARVFGVAPELGAPPPRFSTFAASAPRWIAPSGEHALR